MKLLTTSIAVLFSTFLAGCSTSADHSAHGAKDSTSEVISDAHAGHAMAAGAPAAASNDPHAGHAMPAPSSAASTDPHAAHTAMAAADDPAAHADHHARHGGVLTMEGDYHVEIVVAPDGAIDLYLSDAIRNPVPPGAGTVTIQGSDSKTLAVPLTADTTRGSLSAKGPAPDGSTTYTWDIKAPTANLKMSLAVPRGGTKSIASPASHAHNH